MQSQKILDTLEFYRLKRRGPVLVCGRSVGEKIAHGPVRVIQHAQHLHDFQTGEVLVTARQTLIRNR